MWTNKVPKEVMLTASIKSKLNLRSSISLISLLPGLVSVAFKSWGGLLYFSLDVQGGQGRQEGPLRHRQQQKDHQVAATSGLAAGATGQPRRAGQPPGRSRERSATARPRIAKRRGQERLSRRCGWLAYSLAYVGGQLRARTSTGRGGRREHGTQNTQWVCSGIRERQREMQVCHERGIR